MKLDLKKRIVQQRYREKMKQEKYKKKHTMEALLVVFFIVLLFILNVLFGNDLKPNSDIEEVDNIEERAIQYHWMKVTPKIDQTLKVTSSQYTGIAIDLNPKPIKYILSTSIQESNLNNDENLNELINVANEIITSNNIPNLLQENETYEIIVEGKNKKELKRKVFH